MAKFVTIGERIHCISPAIREAMATRNPEAILKRAKEHRQKPFSAGFTNPSAASKSRWTRQGCGQRRASIFQLGQGVFLNSIHFVRSQGMEEQLENLRNAVKALKKRIERPSPSAITGSLP